MPPKKQIQLQEILDNQDNWDKFTKQDGLQVIDVYSEWCGPCKAVVSLFRRLKNELGDDLLRFAIAKSDTIESLAAYRNRSEPSFLMISNSVLVGVVHGCKGPDLERMLKEKLQYEHKVLDGEGERTQISDDALQEEVIIPDLEEIEEDTAVEQVIEPTKKQVTLLLIKPDITAEEGKVQEIVEKLESEGYEILNKEERQLTKEEAAEFYKHHEESEQFEELIEFMSSGSCMTLIVSKGQTGDGVIDEVRQLIGPPDVEKAKEEAPECLRAQYGTNIKMNALHASDSHETAARELAFFFPNYNIPWVPGTEPPIQRTLALIRPGIMDEHKDAILAKIKESGFSVAFSKEMTLTKELAEAFYKELKDKDYYDSLCTKMSSGPVLALCLAREFAVEKWRELIGPTSIEQAKEEAPDSLRAQFALDDDPDINCVHGTKTEEEADKEIQFFFPKEKTLAVIKPSAIDKKEEIVKKIEEIGFNVSLNKEQQLTKEIACQLYADHKDSEYFEELTDYMSSGPSLVMVLTKEEAVIDWRALMGPKNPMEAKTNAPESLRALYGEDNLKNAVHGSSTSEHAMKTIKMLFGDVEFGEDGTIKDSTADDQQEDTPITTTDEA